MSTAKISQLPNIGTIHDVDLIEISQNKGSYYTSSNATCGQLITYLSSFINPTSSFLDTGSTYPITSSWANNVATSSFAMTSSYLIYPSVTLTIINNSIIPLISIQNTTYNSIFVTYILNDNQNFRAGNVVVLYNTQSAILTETSTTDIGDSSGLTFSASLSASNVNLLAVNSSNNNYSVKYHLDVL